MAAIKNMLARYRLARGLRWSSSRPPAPALFDWVVAILVVVLLFAVYTLVSFIETRGELHSTSRKLELTERAVAACLNGSQVGKFESTGVAVFGGEAIEIGPVLLGSK